MILLGYGVTTKALAKSKKDVIIYDDKFEKISIDNNGNRLIPSKYYIKTDDLTITSPGISPDHFLIKNSNNIISEYDYFKDKMPYSIWISGTNGKTTTTKMIAYLLQENDAIFGGNIGVPLADMDIKKSIWVLETSSFMLHYTRFAKPNLYILLPIKEDHISWHGNFEKYKNAKLKPISLLSEGEVAIVPYEYKDIKTDGFLIPYKNSTELCNYFGIDINKITHKEPFLLDAILALAVKKILFDVIDYDKINSFKNDNHKLQEFYDYKNRLWVNDSKATNVDASLHAIRRYSDKKIFLIIGGESKGIDNRQLFELFIDLDIELFIIGLDADKLEKLSKQYKIEYTISKELKSAVKEIDKRFIDGVAILSPAASSLDQFKNYKNRGDMFMKYVSNLREAYG